MWKNKCVPFSVWELARRWLPRGDPIVLDLDGDGLETTVVEDWETVRFDHNDDGIKTATGWVKPDDGLLVMDFDGNGAINSGRELFGDNTQLSDSSLAEDGFIGKINASPFLSWRVSKKADNINGC